MKNLRNKKVAWSLVVAAFTIPVLLIGTICGIAYKNISMFYVSLFLTAGVLSFVVLILTLLSFLSRLQPFLNDYVEKALRSVFRKK